MENVLIEELRKSVFRNENGQVVLDLRGKHLSHVPQAVTDLTDVEVLDLSFNTLVELPTSINKFKNLKELCLRYNNLTKLPESIGELDSLIALLVNDNQLSKLPTSIKHLTKLQILHLNNNQIKEIDDIIYLEELRILHLEHNQLSVLPANFRRLKKLQKLFLNNNELETFPEDILCFEELEWLTLNHNQLSEIPSSIIQLKQLQILYISNNNLKEIPQEICALKHLKGLNLDENPLKLDDEGIRNLMKLRKERLPYISIIFPASVMKPQEQFLKEDGKTFFDSNVTVEGVSLNSKEAGACITIPSMAVTKPKQITCLLLNPTISSPPLTEDAILVSNVTELSCDSSGEGLNKKVKVALSHSAPDLRGYEVVIQVLVDKERNEWKDLETRNFRKPSDLEDDHSKVPEWLYPFAEAETTAITHCSSFAVISRLKSFTFYKPTSETTEFTCTVTEFPSVSVTVPQSSVPASEDFSLTIKVQEVACYDCIEEKPGPVIHISCSEEVTLLQLATITIPLTLRVNKESLQEGKSSQVRIFFAKDKSREWADISEELTLVDIKNGVVTFQVSHFSLFWLWCVPATSAVGAVGLLRLVDFVYKRCQPQTAVLVAYLCKSSGTLELMLCCCPLNKLREVKDDISKLDVCNRGEMKQKCYHGNIFFFRLVSLTPVKQLPEEEMFIQFSDNECRYYGFTRNALLVKRVGTDNPQIEFFKPSGPDGEKRVMCTVSLLDTVKKPHKEQEHKVSVPNAQDVLHNEPAERKVSEPTSQEVLQQQQERKVHASDKTASTSEKIPEKTRPSNSSFRMLNIVSVANEWGSSRGGMSTINRDIAVHLAKQRNVKVTYIVLDHSCSKEEKAEANSHNICIVEVQTRSDFRGFDSLFYPTRDLCISFVVGHGVQLGRHAEKIRKSCSCKWMQVVHTDPEELAMFKDGDSNALTKGEDKIEAEVELCKMADIVVAVGPKLREVYSRKLRGTGKDVIEITPGITKELKGLQPHEDNARDFQVLLFGRSDANDFEIKGYDIAAKAFAHHELKGKPYKLVYVGADKAEKGRVAILKRLCQHGIDKNQLIIKKFKNRTELEDVLRQVDLAIMPSKTEGFGLTGLEAFSAGLPVLVSRNSGFARALEELPLAGKSCIVESEDPEVWAKAITDVRWKNRADRLKGIQMLLKLYEEKYSWEKQCQTLVEKMRGMIFGEETPLKHETHSKHRECKDAEPEQVTNEAQMSAASEQIFHVLQQMQCNADIVINKTDLLAELEKTAADKGFRICDNRGSGNCMFYALSEQMELVKGIKITHKKLRRSVVQYLEENPKLPDGTELFKFVHGYRTWGDYLRNMVADGTWGDHVTLHAAANCYGTCIRVISSQSHHQDFTINPEHDVGNRNPLVLGHIQEYHYVSLRATEGFTVKTLKVKID